MTRRASMKHGWIAIALACGACAASNESASTAKPAQQPVAAAQPAQAAPAAGASGVSAFNATSVEPVANAGPTIPAGARFTIFCESITTDDHVARAAALKESLMKNARARDWYVIHQEGRSSIYLGYYKEYDESVAGRDVAALNDAKRAKADKQIVDSLPNPRDPAKKLFPRAQFTQLDAPDPDAPPQWNLATASGYWSVQVAAFTGPDRKLNAVDAVRQARAMNIEAYYYHGDTTSSLCIGHWPAEALKRQSTGDVQTRNENDTIVVDLTPGELSPQERAQMAANGQKVFKARVEIVDPTLKATLNQYPEHALNNVEQRVTGNDRKTGRRIEKPVPSFIVQIPNSAAIARAQAAAAAENSSETSAQPAAPRGPVGAPPPDLGSRLRGIGQ